MTLDEAINNRIREIVREELKQTQSPKSELLFTTDELAARWKFTDTQAIARLVKSGQLRCVRLSQKKMLFTIQEVRRFEESGGVEIAA